jgi:hypothetical protein
MPTVKNVGEPCAGEPHARIEVAAGGNRHQSACRTALAPPADPTSRSQRGGSSTWLACTANPDGRWVAQQARNLVMQLGDEQPFRFHVHDRDAKFWHAFDQVFRSEAIRVIRTPVHPPNANAHAERRVRTLGADCLDRILILGRRHLEHILRVYRQHYNEHRPHRALRLLPPDGRKPDAVERGRPSTPSRPPRRTHPRILGRLNLRTLRAPASSAHG